MTFFSASWYLMSALDAPIAASPKSWMAFTTSSIEGAAWSDPSFAFRIAWSSRSVLSADWFAFGSICPNARARRVESSAVSPI